VLRIHDVQPIRDSLVAWQAVSGQPGSGDTP
jgi:hypothetical protein